MPITKISAMPPDVFRAEMTARGWSEEMLSQRWGMTKRRIYQIIADDDRPRYYDDAVRALPYVLSSNDSV